MTRTRRGWPEARRPLAAALVCTALIAASSPTPALGGTGSERAGLVRVTVLHAIPTELAGETVDVYAGERLIAANLTPGSLRSLTISAGRYDISVLPDGTTPGRGEPLLEERDTRLRAGDNVTVAAHLSSAGEPVITTFINSTTTVGMGQGRLTVRNVAAGPAFDVLVSRSVMAKGLRNGQQAEEGLSAGRYLVRIVSPGTRTPLMRPARATIVNQPGRQDMGNNVIVYVWGAGPGEPLRQVSQSIPLDLG